MKKDEFSGIDKIIEEKQENGEKDFEKLELMLLDFRYTKKQQEIILTDFNLIKSFIRRQIAKAIEEYATTIIPKMTKKWRGYVKEAEKRGYEKMLKPIKIFKDGKWVDGLCYINNKIRQEARKEFIEEIGKWTEENQEDDGEIVFVDYTDLLSKLKQLK